MTKLRDIYARDGLTFSIEFFPPKTPEGMDSLFAELPELKKLDPAFVSVTYGAGGTTQSKTLQVVRAMKYREKLEVMCHVTIVNQPLKDVKGMLGDLWGSEIENIIALAGDPPEGASVPWTAHPDGYQNARELIDVAKRGQAGWYDFFSVAVAGFPEVHPRAESRESDLKYLKEKVDAGADVVITQLFFDNDDYFRYVEDARAHRHHGADRPRRAADPLGRAGAALHEAVRREDPAAPRGAARQGRGRRRGRHPARHRLRDRAVRGPDRVRRPRAALLLAQQGALGRRDPREPEPRRADEGARLTRPAGSGGRRRARCDQTAAGDVRCGYSG